MLPTSERRIRSFPCQGGNIRPHLEYEASLRSCMRPTAYRIACANCQGERAIYCGCPAGGALNRAEEHGQVKSTSVIRYERQIEKYTTTTTGC